MPTINQLPIATAVSGTDQIPISQSGLTRSVTVGTLLGGTQSTISLSQGYLLGRVSVGLGGPQSVGVGIGLSLQGDTLSATGQDHISFPQAPGLLSGDEVLLNSGLTPKRLAATALRSLFSAGSGVTIDPNGVISSTVTSTGGGGSTGPQGATGPQGVAGQGFSFKGAWQPSTSYAAYDVIVSGGQSYVVTNGFTSAQSFDPSRLTLIAAQGSPGAAGPQGPAGPQGSTGPQGPAGPTVPATASVIGAVKPGAGLTVTTDGSLGIANVSLASLAQTGAATGQLLGWTGTGWGPTTATAGGVTTFNGRNGAVSLSVSDVTAVLGTGAGARATLGLSAVASTGAFSDLTGTPAIPSASTTAPAPSGAASPGVSSTFARSDHVHPTDSTRLAAVSNLSDVANVTTARANLGLGAAATLNVGTAANTVAAGNDSRLANALQPAAIPAASGQLLGGSASLGTAVAVAVGPGLTLTGGTLSATATGGGGVAYTLPAATTTSLGGVKPDGATITASADGTLTVNGTALTALPDISTLGGPALSDIDIINRNNNDYRTTLSARVALFRRTPSGSRTITLSTSATTATLTAADHDKIVVVAGSAGTLAVDGTITDGFRCQVINHTSASLALSGITGLGATSLAAGNGCWVSLSNSTVEATFGNASSGASTYTLPTATTTTLGGVKPDGSTVTSAADGTLSVASMSTTALTDIGTLGGPALTDVDVLNRSGNDYKTTLSARSSLFRRTPAGSRTITLAAGATTATLTAADHDKTVVVTGVAGILTVDNTITDGFRCHVINHTAASLGFTAIAGLQGTTSLPSNASCAVSFANAIVEASPPGSATAYFSAGVAGIVANLPGGAAAAVYRHVFVRPCTLGVGLATPYSPQGQAGTLPTATAAFAIAKRQSNGTQTTIGNILMSPTGAVTANAAAATNFVAGDELIVIAPSPADSTLADVSLTFTGTWG